MGDSILWDLAVLLGLAAFALCTRSRSASLSTGLILFGLVGLDLIGQLSANPTDRALIDAMYPHLYRMMLLKNFAMMALAVVAIVRAVEFSERATEKLEHATGELRV